MYLIQSQSEKAVLLFEQLLQAQMAQIKTTDHQTKMEYQHEIHRIIDELRLEGM